MSQSLSCQGYGDALVAVVYQPRTYRQWIKSQDLVTCSVVADETDLLISARTDLSSQALEIVQRSRAALEDYIRKHPVFLSTLEPLPVESDAPALVRAMSGAARTAGVGPMAAVAGAIAEEVGTGLLCFSDEVIVENGGDIFIKSLHLRLVGLYAGVSPLTGKIAFIIEPEQTPLGICTSSGTVGHSLSFGMADAVTVISPSAALADAAATAIGNRVRSADDIPGGIEFGKGLSGVRGIAIVKEDKLGLWGDLRITSLD